MDSSYTCLATALIGKQHLLPQAAFQRATAAQRVKNLRNKKTCLISWKEPGDMVGNRGL